MSAGLFDQDDASAEINDPVWRLLGRASMPRPDGWFTARTLARCRTPERRGGWGVWRWALGMGLGLAVATVAVTRLQDEQVVAKQKNVQEAFDIVASVGTDADSSSDSAPTSWEDSSL
jgi:hypothetical protein